MATLNVSHMIGRLTNEPEIKTLQSGKTVAKFRLAVGRGKKLPNGTWDNSDSTYIDCEAWHNPDQKRNLPSVIQQYLHKGDEVYVQGEIREQSWDDKTTGQKRNKHYISLTELQLMGGGQKRDSGDDFDDKPAPVASGGEPDPDMPFSWLMPFAGGVIGIVQFALA